MFALRACRLLVLASITVSLLAEARAGSVTAVTRRLDGTFAANPNGKFSVFAYSESNSVKNSISSYNGVGGAANIYNTESFPAPIPGVGNQQLNPIVGNKDVDKGAQGFGASTQSLTAGAYGFAAFDNVGGGKVKLQAVANTTPGIPGIGAGRSIDPIDIDPR